VGAINLQGAVRKRLMVAHMLTAAFAALLLLLLVPGGRAHPASLECGTDETTRLSVGSTIMGKRVGTSGLLDGVIVGNTCYGGVMMYWSVQAPNGTFFAARVMGGGAIDEESLRNQSTLKITGQSGPDHCPQQLYTDTAPGGHYARISLVNATNKTYVVVGAWNGKARPFGEGVHLTVDTCSDR